MSPPPAPVRHRGRWRWPTAVLAALLVVLAAPAAAQAQAGDGQLTIDGVANGDGSSRIVVSVPPGTPTPAPDSSTVTVDGRRVDSRVEPLAGPDAPLLLVVDTGTSPELFRPLQGALIELARRLGPEQAVTLADSASGTATSYGTDRAALTIAIADLTVGEGKGVAAATDAGRATVDGTRPVTVVVTANASRFPSSVAADPAAPVWVVVLSPTPVDSGPAADAARAGGTPVVTVADPNALLPAIGGIAGDISSRLVVTTSEVLDGTTLEVQVPGATGPLTGTAQLSDLPTSGTGATAPDAPADEGSGPPWLLLALAALALAVVAGLVVFLVRRRRGAATAPAPAPVAAQRPAPPVAAPAAPPAAGNVTRPSMFGPGAAPAPVAPAAPTGAPPAPRPATFTAPPGTPSAPVLPAMSPAPPPGNGSSAPVNGVSTEVVLGDGGPLPVRPSAKAPQDDLPMDLTIPAGPAPHLFSVDPQPIDLRRQQAGQSNGDLALATTERSALDALAELAAQRAQPGPRVPADLYLGLEAAASAWLLDNDTSPVDLVTALAPGVAGRGHVAGILAALRTCLTLPAGTGGRDAADRAVEQLRASDDGGVPLPPLAGAGRTPSLAALATEAALVERVDRYGRLCGPAARSVLSTGPARTGLADGVPVVVSPSLVPGEEPASNGMALDTRSVTMLLALTDGAARMAQAEFRFRQAATDLDHHVAASGAADGLATADLLTALTTRAVLTPATFTTGLGLGREHAVELSGRLVEAGVLRQESAADDGSPLWVVASCFDAATAPFAHTGLVSEAARQAVQHTGQDAPAPADGTALR